MNAQERLAAAEDHNPGCLACGSRNPASLGFTVERWADGALRATVALRDVHEGAAGRAHGGMLMTALDEGLGRLAYLELGGDCVTATMSVDFLRPGAPGQRPVVACEVVRREGRKLWVSGDLRVGDEPIARAEALFISTRRA
ncbi:PaaI family thioesterase [Conexibacter sp. SYSU D00693]|uniref:PaaI family thioesterase n=1 Tax=Conexibacter sp. SYSU D00693 TaxID=2812560 RepID=UPI00196B01A7|nr:PaaI family thioesterase [Conexibacter sp. SYSU D00693]